MGHTETILRGVEAVGADRLMRPWLAGRGVIFVLHRAAPAAATVLDPDLTITADVLDHALRLTRDGGYDVVSLDEVAERLGRSNSGRFAAFTFDDGYRDNLTTALPVFRAHGLPMCVYVATGLIDRTASYWWGAVAHLVETQTEVRLHDLGVAETLPSGVVGREAGGLCAHRARGCMATWKSRGDTVLQWCRDAAVSTTVSVLDAAMLTWDELREMADDPLVTIGAHTLTHRRLARLDEETAGRELAGSRARLEQELDRPVRHLAYPYGGPAACGARASSGLRPTQASPRR